MYNTKISVFLLLSLALFACNSKPKVIEAENSGSQGAAPIFQDPGAAANPSGPTAATMPSADMSAEEHHGTVAEVLNTEKYTYLRLKENNEERWVAITKRDIKVGASCIYKGGLMKRNFFSKEFNRVFDTVYLVGDFREEGAAQSAMPGGANIPAPAEALEAPKSVKAAPGAIKISELVANLKKYEGKTVKITGKCVKVNPMIMGRNWLHIQDGSGKNLDLTVTTVEQVQLGSIVTLEGTIAVNKDFGAGYRYDYIMEAAVQK